METHYGVYLRPQQMGTDHLYNALKLVFNALVAHDLALELYTRQLDKIHLHKVGIMDSYLACRPSMAYESSSLLLDQRGEW